MGIMDKDKRKSDSSNSSNSSTRDRQGSTSVGGESNTEENTKRRSGVSSSGGYESPPPISYDSKPSRPLSLSISDVAPSTSSEHLGASTSSSKNTSPTSSPPPSRRSGTYKLPPKTGSILYSVIYDKSNSGLEKIDEEDLIGRVNLQRVILGRNKLTEIPERIGELTKVNTLDFSYNRLKSLPVSISNLPELTTLLLAGNQFMIPATTPTTTPTTPTSTPPTIIEQLGDNNIETNHIDIIDELELNIVQETTSSNISTTTIPAEFGYISTLKKVDLTSNIAADHDGETYLPPSLFWFSQVQLLLLAHCRLCAISTDVQHLQALTSLDISYNCLHELPVEIGQLKHLVTLNVRNNVLVQLPLEIGHLELLTSLDLCHNSLTSLPDDLCYLSNLETLNLSHNQLKELPPTFFDQGEYLLVSLRDLRVRGNQLTRLPESLFSIGCQFDYLDVSDNQLTQLPRIETALETLSTLAAFNNKLTQLPTNLFSHLPSLTNLNLSDNQLEELPSSIWNDCPSLSHLYIGYNPRLKSLPFPLDQFYSLEELYLNGNEQLTIGATDPTVEYFPSLRELSLASCKWTQVPRFLYMCVALEKLDLSNNLLKSVDWHTLKQLENLVVLMLSHNQLDDIPFNDFLPSLSNLSIFDLSSNQLTNPQNIKSYQTQNLVIIHHNNNNNGDDILWKKSNRFEIDMSEMIGRRPTMEDAFSIRGSFHNDPKLDLVTLFDGHAGSKAASYSCEWFPIILSTLMDRYPSLPPQQWLKQAYSEVSSQFKQYIQNERPEYKYCGATAAAVLITDRYYYVSNIGDTRIVLCRGGSAIRLSFDHKPNDIKEEARIRRAGGFVISNGDTARVNGTLAVSRSIGDFYMEPYVVPDPHLSITESKKDDQFLIVACDGVWDELGDQAACDLVLSSPSIQIASQKLRDYSFFKGSDDNITCIIIKLSSW